MFLSFGCVSDAGACGSHVAAAEVEAGSGRGGTVSPRLHCVALPRGQASPEPDRKQTESPLDDSPARAEHRHGTESNNR